MLFLAMNIRVDGFLIQRVDDLDEPSEAVVPKPSDLSGLVFLAGTASQAVVDERGVDGKQHLELSSVKW